MIRRCESCKHYKKPDNKFTGYISPCKKCCHHFDDYYKPDIRKSIKLIDEYNNGGRKIIK